MLDDEKALRSTLDLSREEMDYLMRAMNHAASRPLTVPNRRRLRLPFDHARAVVLKPMDDRGSDMRFTVQPRNLSRWGIAVIHGRFMHQETVCLVAIPALGGNYTVHSAMVRNCRHVRGTVHELSLVFSDPVALDEYIVLNEEQLAIVEHETAEEEKSMDRAKKQAS